MSDTVKSIFRQREIEKLYELGVKNEYTINHLNWLSKINETLVEVTNEDKVISDKEIGRYDIEIPMLEVGDEFFLHDIQETIKIKSKMRSSDGSITYYAEDKVVETVHTHISYDKCCRKLERWNHEEEKIKELKDQLSSVEHEFSEYKKKYKYENRFFNKKCS